MLLSLIYTELSLPVPSDCPEIDCSDPMDAEDAEDALIYAIEKGGMPIVERLLQVPAVLENIAAGHNNALRCACENGHLEIVKRLLEFPAVLENVNEGEDQALTIAAGHGYLPIVEYLLTIPAVLKLENGIAVNQRALSYAADNGNLLILERLLGIPAFLSSIKKAFDAESLKNIANKHPSVMERLLKEPLFLSSIPSNNVLLNQLIDTEQLKLIHLLLRSSRLWIAGLSCLNEENRTPLRRGILKTSLQAALFEKLANFSVYPEDEDFVQKAKRIMLIMSDEPVPDNLLEEIITFKTPLSFYCPLPQNISLDLYPKILQFLGFDIPNKALKYLEAYYLAPTLNHIPILKAYDAIDKSKSSCLRRNANAFIASDPMDSSFAASASTLATSRISAHPQRMEIDESTSSHPGQDADLSKKRRYGSAPDKADTEADCSHTDSSNSAFAERDRPSKKGRF